MQGIPRIDLSQIRAALDGHAPRRRPEPTRVRDRACVSLMLAGPQDTLALCLIRRARRDRDPWSGQMAFPGGRRAADDPSPEAVAQRETLEEVGVDLRRAELIGALSEHPLHREAASDGALSPFVYYVGDPLPPLVPEPSEVDAAYWIPLEHLWDPRHVTSWEWTYRGMPVRFPGIAWGDDVIWGLTHRVLLDLAQLLGHPMPSASPIKAIG